jgi:hypothetical protein
MGNKKREHMAERDIPMNKILSNVEQELRGAPAAAPRSIEAFTPQKYRNPSSADSMQQIQQDFHRTVTELEQRFAALTDELKRIAGSM